MSEPTEWLQRLLDEMLANPDRRYVVNMPRTHGRGVRDRFAEQYGGALNIKVIRPGEGAPSKSYGHHMTEDEWRALNDA